MFRLVKQDIDEIQPFCIFIYNLNIDKLSGFWKLLIIRATSKDILKFEDN